MPPLVPVRIWQEIPVLTPSPTLINTEDKYCVENITERLDDGKEYSSITIDYNNFRALRIQQKVDAFEHNGGLPHPQAIKSKISPKCQAYSLRTCIRFPCMRLPYTGRYWENLQNYLITQLIPDSNGESEETTTYTYTLDNWAVVTSCNAVVRH